ncbi:alkaline phosphatase D family protein [Halarcobacter sp.]|uniref:alkaline phosphatase D family protein n=1 Tax=Halarcobacter sp. TaxID=2321133 RepID=UPI002AA6463A|nr:alkaline phosphatase D family protein [Halarcobacter sp.]
MTKITRRDFLRISALTASSLVVSTAITGCSGGGNDTAFSLDFWNTVDVNFNHGVASGDPTINSVILWTRITPASDISSVNLFYQVSENEDFTPIVRSGKITTKKEQDYTVKIDLQDLEENKTYYYRFKSNEKTSIVGKTKTISSNPSEVKMAVFSCSNYPNGYFNAYMEASKMQLDVALHLGDYIYEYGMYENDDGVTPAYATKNAIAIGRELPEDNNTELLTLDDYRKRYALYRTDEGALVLHQNLPVITIWDDHEIANDTYKDGAENHDSSEGEFSLRKEHALQAYFEWLPIRPFEDNNNEIIYRNFEFGNLVNLYMLDTRVLGRDKQLSYSDYFDNLGNFDSATFTIDLLDSSRTMLGSEQLTWLQNSLSNSTATWQVLGQQVLMGKMFLPAELLTMIAQLDSDITDAQKLVILTNLNTAITELIAIKTRILANDTTLTTAEKARVETTLPYNLDAWDGYFYEREVILGTSKALGKNLVVLAGDTHNSWASEIKDQAGDLVGVEYAVTSVTSPGMEDYAGLTNLTTAQNFEAALTFLIDDLKYTNLNQRGFMVVSFTSQEVNTTWYYVDNYDSTTYSLDQTREKSLKTLVNTNTIS